MKAKEKQMRIPRKKKKEYKNVHELYHRCKLYINKESIQVNKRFVIWGFSASLYEKK
tara:strand:- start:156 stop:326 length:171 start_codon:yes stop_codon:yes gene_type:complete